MEVSAAQLRIREACSANRRVCSVSATARGDSWDACLTNPVAVSARVTLNSGSVSISPHASPTRPRATPSLASLNASSRLFCAWVSSVNGPASLVLGEFRVSPRRECHDEGHDEHRGQAVQETSQSFDEDRLVFELPLLGTSEGFCLDFEIVEVLALACLGRLTLPACLVFATFLVDLDDFAALLDELADRLAGTQVDGVRGCQPGLGPGQFVLGEQCPAVVALSPGIGPCLRPYPRAP